MYFNEKRYQWLIIVTNYKNIVNISLSTKKRMSIEDIKNRVYDYDTEV